MISPNDINTVFVPNARSGSESFFCIHRVITENVSRGPPTNRRCWACNIAVVKALITVARLHKPPPCHPCQADTSPPPPPPQSLLLPPPCPPPLPFHCCPPPRPHCRPSWTVNDRFAAQRWLIALLWDHSDWCRLITSSSLPSSSSSPSSDSSLSSKNLDLPSPASFDKEEQEGPASPSVLLAFSAPLELPDPDPPHSAAWEELLKQLKQNVCMHV